MFGKNNEKRINDDNIKNNKIFINIKWGWNRKRDLSHKFKIFLKKMIILNFDENLLNEKIKSIEYLMNLIYKNKY